MAGREPLPPPALRITSRWAPAALVLLSLALKSSIFAPLDFWPLAYVCLVPWLFVVRTSKRAGWTYLLSYLFGLSFYLLNMYWLCLVTPPGYVALSIYMAGYFPAMAWLIRYGCVRRGLPMAVVVPVVWTASELARATVMTGFPWFFLSHSQWHVRTMIQIADLTGAYGLSFAIAMVNAALTELLVRWLSLRRAGRKGLPGRALAGPVAAAALLVVIAVYGQVRLRTARLEPGPTVAVLQGDYVSHVNPPPDAPGPREKEATYHRLLGEVPGPVDLYALPETPWSMYLNEAFRRSAPDEQGWVWWSNRCHERLAEAARIRGSYILVGSLSIEPQPPGRYPPDYKYNSAFLYDPTGKQVARYDKVHLVLFGEYVPFRYGRLHWFYRWLNDRTPWGREGIEYSLTPGREFRIFRMKATTQQGREFRFGVPICYEDVMPYISRRFVLGPDGSKRADFLVNISNDGWFHHSTELAQHFAICVFRAVENRVSIVRAVNTGMSGFIDSTGRYRRLDVGRTGYLVDRVPVDPRISLYARWGDWLAVLCCILAGLLVLEAAGARVLGRFLVREPQAEKR